MYVLGILNHPIEGMGNLAEVLNERGFKVKEKMATELKGNEDFDILVIMGGPMGVYEAEKYPFLYTEMELIRKAMREGKKVLGICLGSQLISASLGGSVKKGIFGPEIGISKVKLLPRLGDKEIEVFQWHGDTFTLPPSSELLAYSEKYFQAFNTGQIMALQFHLEVDSKMVSRWVEEYKGDTSLISEVREKEEVLRKNLESIVNWWLGY
ncbi:type 1 glutamine amidotransferase [Stygiolobus caldivivus]|uniref:GMP synthase n=1 Tax=Stygiolobus caldivivus TaxID=2824673 RepID=A0A8D5UAH3_9CREN|nr:type 1 glutamine amidotransferase [Stygiolobus caldivivus]BCU71619.1 GMP synthase [Stygiolobus caldivivus]